MERKLIVLLVAFIALMATFVEVTAQNTENVKNIVSSDLTKLQEDELDLQKMFDKVRTTANEQERFDANSAFIPALVKVLKTPNSFYYPFDSLKSVSILYAPDNSFRIFTWMVVKQKRTYKYYGAIQHNSAELALMPLTDKSARQSSPDTKVFDHNNWYGCIYYDIHQYEHNDSTHYLLFGWDGYNTKSDKKIGEVMHFTDEGKKAVFGAPVFDILTLEERETTHRIILEFKEGSQVNLNYDPKLQMIIYDFLAPEDEETAKTTGSDFAYIPDGTYQGLEFKEGMWSAIPKVFNYSLDSAPVYTKEKNKSKGKKKKSKKKREKKRP